MQKPVINIVWFKRDLRIHDHAPLTMAAQQGQVLPLYIVEPAFWQQPDAAYRHYLFIKECLQELNQALTNLGQHLIIQQGDACQVLQKLKEQFAFQAIYAHEETGNTWTYQRDKAVIAWCKQNKVNFNETPSHGVIRRLNNRDDWAKLRDSRMQQAVIKAPLRLSTITGIASTTLPAPKALGLHADGIDAQVRQRGGRSQAIALLNSFFKSRGQFYTRGMSSPNSAFTSCSRLSPYIVNGVISIREISKALEKQKQQLAELSSEKQTYWRSALKSFQSRLYWRCHFVQKLEDQPDIESNNMHSAFNAMRNEHLFTATEQEKFHAWSTGNTGYPFIDACMRALIQTGWINFRMRAMLVSFASYHLWLHWRETAHHLARLFTDYEPGIHYSQIQMQSGTTGMNIPRMYNPVKQSQDQDPKGEFINRYVPELITLPASDIHQPWLLPPMLQAEYQCIIGKDYPTPIVDLTKAIGYARQQISLARNKQDYRIESKKLIKKHGSRKTKKQSPPTRALPTEPKNQLPLTFD